MFSTGRTTEDDSVGTPGVSDTMSCREDSPVSEERESTIGIKVKNSHYKPIVLRVSSVTTNDLTDFGREEGKSPLTLIRVLVTGFREVS